MHCERINLKAVVTKYELNKNQEDGFELYSDVITKGWIVTDSLVKIQKPNGVIVCPYIVHRRGRTFIGDGDYIVTDEDGTRHVCSEEKIMKRYKEVK